jgi:hypothetical protein
MSVHACGHHDYEPYQLLCTVTAAPWLSLGALNGQATHMFMVVMFVKMTMLV